MAQTAFAHHEPLADPQVGFDIGWDHARHGLLPPPGQWLDGNPLHQRWRAAKACSGGRTLGAPPAPASAAPVPLAGLSASAARSNAAPAAPSLGAMNSNAPYE